MSPPKKSAQHSPPQKNTASISILNTRLQNAAYERGRAGRGKVRASASAVVRNPGC